MLLQHFNIFATVSSTSELLPALIFFFLALAALLCSCVFFTLHPPRGRNIKHLLLGAIYCTTVVILVCTVLCCIKFDSIKDSIEISKKPNSSTDGTTQSTEQDSTGANPSTNPTTENDQIPGDPTTPEIPFDFKPAATTTTDPKNWGIKWEIIQGGKIVDSYTPSESITFGDSSNYTKLEGITTFRGNNYRTDPTYGTATVTEEVLTKIWNIDIGSLNTWNGSGWTGQPLIVRWPKETRQIMNLYPEKKAKENLVEVIYATLDGYIYFLDLEDGSYTRDRLWVGMNFKGAGTLDPRGYPLMYVGSGDYLKNSNTAPKMYIISLIDTTILYEQSATDSFAIRGDGWAAFDSSPLIDAETDTLIWPGESGILYIIKLNTNYDKSAGTISINPQETVKCRYTTSRSNATTYWVGYEPSAVIVDRYLYISENGGMFFCINLDTMELVWAQDTYDDSNSTPVFEWDLENKTAYIYTAPSLHWTADKNSQGNISIYKLNALNGEIIWDYTVNCNTYSGASGGVQSTPLLGKQGTDTEGLIFYTIARTPNLYTGLLVALNTKTGKVEWSKSMNNFTWSSPVAVYTETGKTYLAVCDSAGNVTLYEGATGNVKSTVNIGALIEASPAVFGDTLVIGTKGKKIYALKVS